MKGDEVVGYREDWFASNDSNHGWYTCARCGKKIRKADVDIDHIVPQKYGGSDKLFNLQCLCKHCNRSKQASLKDTLPDLAKMNKQRAVRAVKKNLAFTSGKIVSAVKEAVKRRKK
ncbi:MAG: HNH endonuclease [Selenomonadaceae bacterium]|nr:HNH endonuclease [Selenomonadaceae bacterium]